MKKIILIDDKSEVQADLSAALEPLLSGKYEVEAWSTQDAIEKYHANEDTTNDESNADEDVWFRFFKKEENVAIVVADNDLSGYKSVRISESALADACRQAVTPICTYRRAPSAKSASQSLRGIYGQTKSFTITLDMSPSAETLAPRKIIALADGFAYIRQRFGALPKEIKQQGPAAI